MSGRVYSFSGVDYSGKSTQIRLLEQRLISEGLSVHREWYRPGYSVLMRLLKDVLRGRFGFGSIVKRGGVCQSVNGGGQLSGVNNGFFELLWGCSALVDSLFEYCVRLSYLRRRYDIILCDRWLDDALFDFLLRYEGKGFVGDFIRGYFRFLRVIGVQADCSFFLHLGYSEVVSRLGFKYEPYAESPECRHRRYLRYEDLVDGEGLVRYCVIDASGDVDEVFSRLWEGGGFGVLFD